MGSANKMISRLLKGRIWKGKLKKEKNVSQSATEKTKMGDGICS